MLLLLKSTFLDDTSKIKTYVGSDGLIHFTNKDGADSVLPFSRAESDVTILNLIFHAVGPNIYCPISTPSNLHTSGIIVNKDSGSFTFKNTYDIVCNKSGELIIFGYNSATASGITSKLYVNKNGTETNLPLSYAKLNTTISVKEGDVLQFVTKVSGANWLVSSICVAL